MRRPEIPEVHVGALLTEGTPERTNTDDHTTRFMEKWLPGFSLSLLEKDYERWDMLPKPWFSVVRLPYTAEEDEHEVWGWGIQEVNYGHSVGDNTHEWATELWSYLSSRPEWDSTDGNSWVWEEEADAEDAAEEASRWYEHEHGHEHRHGHPWANNFVYIPDERISTKDLLSAGFVAANYQDSDGDWVRCCGIDGGGYGFMEPHFIKLYFLHVDRFDWLHERADGTKVYVTFDNRHPLEKLADSFTEEE